MSFEIKPYLRHVAWRPGVEIDFDAYPYSIPAVRDMAQIEFHPDVTFFVGENGSGKSTVLEAIALALGYGAEGGTRSMSLLRTTDDSTSSLHESLRLTRGWRKPRSGYFLRAESLYNVATEIDELAKLPLSGDPYARYGGKSLHLRSHGETFMTLLDSFRGQGLYLLDEPEAALSPNRQLAALCVMHRLVRDDSQFIIATHSPILLSYPGARILQFDATGITQVDYEDTEHYAVTRDFLDHYPRRLEQLLKDALDDAP